MGKTRAIERCVPLDYCKIEPEEVTLMVEGLFWFTIIVTKGVSQDVLTDFIPTGVSHEAYVWYETHGWYVGLSAAQGWALHDRMDAEGGLSAYLRARGLLR